MSESESLLLPRRFSHIQISGIFGANLNIENIGKVEKKQIRNRLI